jgi:flagellum-specific peptidoglycan hydrolase FlgJ
MLFDLLLILQLSLGCYANSGAEEQYIAKWKDEAILQMVEHRIPASITLAQGMLESGNGTSRLAIEGNNHFGIKCHNDWTGESISEDDETRGECFRKYKTAHQSFEDHAVFLKKPRYQSLYDLEPDDYKGWAKGLKQCGYATNPQYPQLLINLIERNNLQQYDAEGLSKLGGKSDGNAQRTNPKHQKPNNHSVREEIAVGSNRKIELSELNIKYTVSKEGESLESIAADIDLHPWFLRRFNDVPKNYRLKAGEVIYLQPKKRKGSQPYTTAKSGETLRDISQRCGIKLKKIKHMNPSIPEKPENGSRIRLRP